MTEITHLSTSLRGFVHRLITTQVEVATPLGPHSHLLRIRIDEDLMRDRLTRGVEYFTLDRGWVSLIERPHWFLRQEPYFSTDPELRAKEVDQAVHALTVEASDLLRRAHGGLSTR